MLNETAVDLLEYSALWMSVGQLQAVLSLDLKFNITWIALTGAGLLLSLLVCLMPMTEIIKGCFK
jgi:hypothetical protein